MLLSKRLKELRKRKRLTQEQIAVMIGITRQAYGNYENGDRIPDINTLNKIADILGVKLDYLVGRQEDNNNDYNYKDDPNLSSELKELLDKLTSLPSTKQQEIINLVKIYSQGLNINNDD